jgi:hypothetical protein
MVSAVIRSLPLLNTSSNSLRSRSWHSGFFASRYRMKMIMFAV